MRNPILLTLIFPLFTTASVDPHIPSHWTEGYVIANNIRIHYWRTGGDKPPMVLAHGYSDDQGELRTGNETVTSKLKDGKLVHIKDAGHSVHPDQPERFHAALNGFLREL